MINEQIYYREEQSAIPIDDVIDAISKLHYASIERSGLIILFLTGARVCELDNMFITNVLNDRLIWKPAKNQKGKPRSVILPLEVIQELTAMRLNHGAKRTLLPVAAETFRRMFTKKRPILGEKWLKKNPYMKNGRVQQEYTYQLKGLRKLYATKIFIEKMKYWQSADVGVMFASKELRHSSRNLTATYYLIEDFNKLGLNKYSNMTLKDILKAKKQRTLIDYC